MRRNASDPLASNREWKQWGELDPLWAVASWPDRQKGRLSEWTDDDFYDTGKSDWADFLRQWEQYGLTKNTCLEVGCGAGRITKHLAHSFALVYAVDVSPGMISYATERIHCDNLVFSTTDGLHLPQADGSVTAVFSTHVLQHLDNTKIGLSYFREFYRVLSQKGSLMIHLPLYQLPIAATATYKVCQGLINLKYYLAEMQARIQRLHNVRLMRMTWYDTATLHRYLGDVGFERIEFRSFPTSTNGALHSFVLATKY
jgi:ubiquinone/menaquinone biosynthesis C-methylase UbiE